MSLLLPISEELINELEAVRKSYSNLAYSWSSLTLEKGKVVNDIARIFNKHWSRFIGPFLAGKPWRNSWNFLQDIIGDEAKGKSRAIPQWLRGEMSTKEFIEHVKSVIERILKINK